jgi:histidyl-tRNA synthetase
LGLKNLELQLNTLGTPQERADYREQLISYLRGRFDELDEDSRRRLETNPLRVLDTKNPQMAGVVEDAPSLMEYLGDQSMAHFDRLRQGLDDAGIDYRVNPRLVRGLDYYSLSVFEWVTDSLGAQGTVCAGGRYDGLVEQLGGRATPAVGFAMGVERLISLLEETDMQEQLAVPDVYLVMMGDRASREGVILAEQLRGALPELRLITHCGGGTFKNQLKKADRSQARYALILGEDEVTRREVGLKPLRSKGEQQQIALSQLEERLRALINQGVAERPLSGDSEAAE